MCSGKMGEDASRFRQRANHCRQLARGTSDAAAQRTLHEMADDLEAEADMLDAEETPPQIIIEPKPTQS